MGLQRNSCESRWARGYRGFSLQLGPQVLRCRCRRRVSSTMRQSCSSYRLVGAGLRAGNRSSSSSSPPPCSWGSDSPFSAKPPSNDLLLLLGRSMTRNECSGGFARSSRGVPRDFRFLRPLGSLMGMCVDRRFGAGWPRTSSTAVLPELGYWLLDLQLCDSVGIQSGPIQRRESRARLLARTDGHLQAATQVSSVLNVLQSSSVPWVRSGSSMLACQPTGLRNHGATLC